jgi:hypothetical protein
MNYERKFEKLIEILSNDEDKEFAQSCKALVGLGEENKLVNAMKSMILVLDRIPMYKDAFTRKEKYFLDVVNDFGFDATDFLKEVKSL